MQPWPYGGNLSVVPPEQQLTSAVSVCEPDDWGARLRSRCVENRTEIDCEVLACPFLCCLASLPPPQRTTTPHAWQRSEHWVCTARRNSSSPSALGRKLRLQLHCEVSCFPAALPICHTHSNTVGERGWRREALLVYCQGTCLLPPTFLDRGCPAAKRYPRPAYDTGCAGRPVRWRAHGHGLPCCWQRPWRCWQHARTRSTRSAITWPSTRAGAPRRPTGPTRWTSCARRCRRPTSRARCGACPPAPSSPAGAARSQLCSPTALAASAAALSLTAPAARTS